MTDHDDILIMDTFEDLRGNLSLDVATCRNVGELDVFRSNDDIDTLVDWEFIETGEVRVEDTDGLIGDDSSIVNVAGTDEVSDISVDRLIVDIFRRTDLLDDTIVHDNDGIRHG